MCPIRQRKTPVTAPQGKQWRGFLPHAQTHSVGVEAAGACGTKVATTGSAAVAPIRVRSATWAPLRLFGGGVCLPTCRVLGEKTGKETRVLESVEVCRLKKAGRHTAPFTLLGSVAKPADRPKICS